MNLDNNIDDFDIDINLEDLEDVNEEIPSDLEQDELGGESTEVNNGDNKEIYEPGKNKVNLKNNKVKFGLIAIVIAIGLLGTIGFIKHQMNKTNEAKKVQLEAKAKAEQTEANTPELVDNQDKFEIAATNKEGDTSSNLENKVDANATTNGVTPNSNGSDTLPVIEDNNINSQNGNTQSPTYIYPGNNDNGYSNNQNYNGGYNNQNYNGGYNNGGYNNQSSQNEVVATSNPTLVENTGTTVEEKKEEKINYITKVKRTMAFMSNNGASKGGDSSSVNGVASNNVLSNEDLSKMSPKEVIAKEPKDQVAQDSYYGSILSVPDTANALSEGLTNREYYLKYYGMPVKSNSEVLASSNVSNVNNKGNISTHVYDEFMLGFGTYIPVAISTPINTDNPSRYEGIVYRDVYDSINHKYTLIPKGTKVYGVYSKYDGSDTVKLNVERMVLPNGVLVNFVGSVVNTQGLNGASGYKDNKYFERTLKTGLAVGLQVGSDLLSNFSLGTKGFSIGHNYWDWNLNALQPPKEDKGNVAKPTNMVSRESARVMAADLLSSNNLSLEEKRIIVTPLIQYSNTGAKPQYNIFEAIVGEVAAKLINDMIAGNNNNNGNNNSNNGNNGNNSNSDNNSGNNGNNGNNNSGISENKLKDIISSYLGNGGNLGNLGLGGNNNNNLIDGLKDLIKGNKESNLEEIRAKMGVNNIVRNGANVVNTARNTWMSVIPTIHVTPGTKVNLYLQEDIQLRPYIITHR